MRTPIIKRSNWPWMPAIVLLGIIASVVVRGQPNSQPGYCGDCFCIPDVNGTTTTTTSCPDGLEPNQNLTSFLPNLLALEWSNPSLLDCDPYTNETCNITPDPLQEGGACVIDFIPPNNGDKSSSSSCPTNWQYATRTFPGSLQEAQNQGLYVTHAGPCGVCSSLQDLYHYIVLGGQLAGEAVTCGISGISGPTNGIRCYQNLGFTEGCATIWHYNGMETQRSCIGECADFYFSGRPNNGPPPSCQLDVCLECDELNAGPLFGKFAGRTRRSSGLISAIARKCSEFIAIPQRDPCPEAPPVTAAPTMMPTSASPATVLDNSSSGNQLLSTPPLRTMIGLLVLLTADIL